MYIEDILEVRTGLIFKTWTFKKCRFCTYATALRMHSGNDDEGFTYHLNVGSVSRLAAKDRSVSASGHEFLFTLDVEGVNLVTGDAETLRLRCKDEVAYERWFTTLHDATSKEPPRLLGAPKIDPRYNLPLIFVPPQHLFYFQLLDKAVMYYFGEVRSRNNIPPLPTTAAAKNDDDSDEHHQEHQDQAWSHVLSSPETKTMVLCIFDKYVYLFNTKADVVVCVPIRDVRGIVKTTRTAGYMAIQVKPPHRDIVFSVSTPQAERDIVRILYSVVYIEQPGKKLEVDLDQPLRVTHDRSWGGLRAFAPTPRAKLAHALRVFSQKHAKEYTYHDALESVAKYVNADAAAAGKKEEKVTAPLPTNDDDVDDDITSAASSQQQLQQPVAENFAAAAASSSSVSGSSFGSPTKKKLCVVCHEREAACCLVSCGHLCLCNGECRAAFEKTKSPCPICRHDWVAIIQVYEAGVDDDE